MECTFDPADPAFHRDPYGVYRAMRADTPLYLSEKYGFYALTRFDDVFAAARDPLTFSSADPTVTLLPMLNYLDAPLHHQLRSIVSRAFTPRRVAEMENLIRQIARADRQVHRRSAL